MRMNNPYAAKKYVTASGEPISDNLRRTGSREALINNNGSFNAGSKKEMMEAIGTLYKLFNAGQVKASSDPIEAAAIKAEKDKIIADVRTDQSGEAFKVMGEVVGDMVWETMGREAFGRNLLQVKTLKPNEDGKIRLRKKDVVAWFMTQDTHTTASIARQNFIYPPEYYLQALILAEDAEIDRSGGDFLDEKYNDALENLLVQEDRIIRKLLKDAAMTVNDVYYFNVLTPSIFSALRLAVAEWGIPVLNCLLAFNLWDDIIAATEFGTWFSPIEKHELVLEGNLGAILGVNLITDAFRHENLKVLERGEIFMVGAPNTLGAILQRKELTTKAVDKYFEGRPQRGWYFQAIQSTTVANSKAVSFGQKV